MLTKKMIEALALKFAVLLGGFLSISMLGLRDGIFAFKEYGNAGKYGLMRL